MVTSHKIQVDVQFPDGFEPTGEFIQSHYISEGTNPCMVGSFTMRRIWQPPASIQLIADALGGCWVFLGGGLGDPPMSEWYVTNSEPAKVEDSICYGCTGHKLKRVTDFEIWFGKTFTAPEGMCVYVKPQQAAAGQSG